MEIKTQEDAQKFLESFVNDRRSVNTLRERNIKKINKQLIENETVKAMRDSMKARFGFDPVTDAKRFPVMETGFSWSKVRNKLMKEADSSTAFTQFLRAGLQQIVNGMYQATGTTFEDWVTTVSSNKQEEPYAPNQGVAFPREVPQDGKYPEVGAAALDLKLANRKYGAVYGVTEELLNDDQSGTFQQQAGMLGEYMRILTEVLCYGKLASVASMQYIDFLIPQTETKPSYESVYPWAPAATPLRGGGITRATTFSVLTQGTLQSALIAQMSQKNLQGIKMLVKPSRLIVGPAYAFDAAVLLNSSYYPSGAAAAGAVGGAFAINPIKGIVDLTLSRFVFKNDGTVAGDSKAWYVVDDSKPWFVCQMREPVAIVQEASNAGQSFENDVMRFKGRTRMNADFIDPRFAYQGNDGSVTS